MYLPLADLLVSSRHPAGAGDGSEEEDDVGDDCDDGDNDSFGVSVWGGKLTRRTCTPWP